MPIQPAAPGGLQNNGPSSTAASVHRPSPLQGSSVGCDKHVHDLVVLGDRDDHPVHAADLPTEQSDQIMYGEGDGVPRFSGVAEPSKVIHRVETRTPRVRPRI
jgi:hypothetical protein